MAQLDQVNFCQRCGERLGQAELFGRLRPACPACGWVYFADPKVAAAALVEEAGRILLVQRANDPQRGLWTLPAGFVDAGEDPRQAVTRECEEETGLQVLVMGLVDVLYGQEHPRGAHIIIFYRAAVIGGELRAGDDAQAVAFFDPSHLPSLAFATTRRILGLGD